MSEKNPNDVVQDVPAAEAKAEGQKLEWGQRALGFMSYFNAVDRCAEINSKLAEGEKPWRLPTQDELLTRLKETGFPKDRYYFSSTGVKEAYYATDRYSTGTSVNFDGRIFPSRDATKENGAWVILVRDAD